MPKTPHSDAGMRTEPPPSLPSASGTMRGGHGRRRAGARAARRAGRCSRDCAWSGRAGCGRTRRSRTPRCWSCRRSTAPARAQPLDDHVVLFRHVIGVEARAEGGAQAARADQVLDRRPARRRAAPTGLAAREARVDVRGRGAGTVGVERAEGVQRAVERRDAAERLRRRSRSGARPGRCARRSAMVQCRRLPHQLRCVRASRCSRRHAMCAPVSDLTCGQVGARSHAP